MSCPFTDKELQEILDKGIDEARKVSYVLDYIIEDILDSDMSIKDLVNFLKNREVFNKYSIQEIEVFIKIVRDLKE